MNRLIINTDQATDTINRNIYGHFAEHLGRGIYEGIWVGENSSISNTRGIRNDAAEALRALGVPVLRWPGGCFADSYHWQDGIGRQESRPITHNVWWNQPESNAFGTHEFLDLCELIGADPYICGNVGSGTVQEMQQWVEYVTFGGTTEMADLRRRNGKEEPWRLPYFGIGNENWFCGGRMRPEYYADVYRRYQTYVRSFGENRVFKIACGPNVDDYEWTEVLMREAGRYMDGLSLHFYTKNRYRLDRGEETKGAATGFGEADWFATLSKCLVMDDLIHQHSAIMDRYDPDKRVALVVDEWGTWYDVEPGSHPSSLYQQNTLRDALVAGLTLNIFNNRCDRVRLANLAQMVNVLQAVILTDGTDMLKTPTYHVFDMYKVHRDAIQLPCSLESDAYEFEGRKIPQLSASASRNENGQIHVTLCNASPHKEAEVLCELRGVRPRDVEGTVLTAEEMDAHNTFRDKERVKPVPFGEVRLSAGCLELALPPMSVVALTLRAN